MKIQRNKNTAELVGLSFGDGGLTYRTGTNSLRFQLRGSLKEDKKHYDTYILPLFNKEFMTPLFNRKVGIVFNEGKGFYGLSVQSLSFKEEFEYLGIPIGVKKELFIPAWIKGNKDYLGAFLRGFFDTDGTITCQRNYSIKNNKLHTQIRIGLSCCSENLISEINNSLKNLGFKTIFRKELRKQINFNPIYTVKLCGGIQVKNWFQMIGSNNPRHITKYQIWQKFGFCPPYTSLEQRKQMLKNQLSPYSFYAGMPEWSNGLERFKHLGHAKDLVA